MNRPSKHMEHRLKHMPKASEKLSDALADFLDLEEKGDDPMKTLLRDFSHHERRSLKTFLDRVLGPDYSDDDLDLIWSRTSSYAYIVDRLYFDSARTLFEAIRKGLG